MEKGICARHYKNCDIDTFFAAGFERISAQFCDCTDSRVSELCAEPEDFENALKLTLDKGIRTLVLPSYTPDSTLLKACDGVKIAIENSPNEDTSPELFAKRIDSLNQNLSEKRFFACLNTGHAILSGSEAEELAEALGDRIISVHANDNHRTGDYHLIAFRGRGGVHWKDTMRALKGVGYQGPIYMDSCIGPENRFKSLTDKCLQITRLVCEHLISLSEVEE